MGCVYKIVCPDTNNIVYIGRALHFKLRMSTHLSNKSTAPLGKWITDLKSNGKKPLFGIIEDNMSELQTGIREDYWINFYKDSGSPLLNKYTSSICDKPGPKAKYDFNTLMIGDSVELSMLKQSSFKSTLSKYNSQFVKEKRQQWGYEQAKKFIIAKRLK